MTELSSSNQAFADALRIFIQSLPPLQELRADLNRWREETERQSAEDFAKMKEDFARLEKEDFARLKKERDEFQKRMEWNERAGFYRMLNSTIRDVNSLVHPMPLPNGGYPAEGTFPETLGDFLSLDAHALTNLLELYELPHEDQVVDARKALAHHCNLPLELPRSTR
ncbi:hypothetical protein RSOLAG22IIIB_11940 [Rhizoctonia solani]|uniref:Uncharacterized protein n=1 Tax=Rhizoctonia solani TaxID=456999 RepID=A0A0K6GAQ1_9AGAM|nr:hypothetical protein RSOLAG22IIIB_11940 [Rhizoctonia solani]